MSTTFLAHTESKTRLRQAVRLRELLKAAVSAAIGGVAVVEAYAAIIKAAGVPMRAGFLGATHAGPITAGSFAVGVLVCTFWGTVLAVVVGRLSQRPRRAFALVGSVLAAVSLVVPFGAGATAGSTKFALAVAHVLAASVVIPILVRAFPRGAVPINDTCADGVAALSSGISMSSTSRVPFEPIDLAQP
jgi:Family of unknown function (DUF6069)